MATPSQSSLVRRKKRVPKTFNPIKFFKHQIFSTIKRNFSPKSIIDDLLLPVDYYPWYRPVRRLSSRFRKLVTPFYVLLVCGILWPIGLLLAWSRGATTLYLSNTLIWAVVISTPLLIDSIEFTEYAVIKTCKLLSENSHVTVLLSETSSESKRKAFAQSVVVQPSPSPSTQEESISLKSISLESEASTTSLQSQRQSSLHSLDHNLSSHFHSKSSTQKTLDLEGLLRGYARPILDLPLLYAIFLIFLTLRSIIIVVSPGTVPLPGKFFEQATFYDRLIFALLFFIQGVVEARLIYYIYFAVNIFLFKLPSVVHLHVQMVSDGEHKSIFRYLTKCITYNMILSFILTFFVSSLFNMPSLLVIVLIFISTIFCFILPHLFIIRITRKIRIKCIRVVGVQLGLLRACNFYSPSSIIDSLKNPITVVSSNMGDLFSIAGKDDSSSATDSTYFEDEEEDDFDSESVVSMTDEIAQPQSSKLQNQIDQAKVFFDSILARSNMMNVDPTDLVSQHLIDHHFLLSRLEQLQDTVLDGKIIAKIAIALLIEIPLLYGSGA